jgi:N-acetylglucosamine malate deacetylase 2
MPTSVLAVVAHPDDESFGLGALLSTASSSGSRAGVLCLTHGEASTLHGVEGDLRVVREAELRAAASRLGLCWVRMLEHPDGAVSEVQAQVVADVADAVRAFHPDMLLVFDPNGITGHPDHRAATRAAVAVGRRHDIDVVAWTLPRSVTDLMGAEGMTMFEGVEDDAIQVRVSVDRSAQLDAVREHPSQAVPGSPLWRRLELLGDQEHLRFLHSTGRVKLPFGSSSPMHAANAS